MDTNKFKNIVGEAKADAVATIKFFGKVTEESTRAFNNEFEWLESCVKPSLIRVLINCEGGSVLYGMSTYATIQNSSIPTECVIEGMAASMGSVIWAAGDKSTMRDYSILMIHNPCIPPPSDSDSPQDSADTPEVVKAFAKQIETIYRKRFGLNKPQVKAIMDGEAGQDGTFFDADSAVKAGIIPSENVIKTSKQVCDKVKNELNGIADVVAIQDIMTKINCEIDAVEIENKQSIEAESNLNQKEKTDQVEILINNTIMEDNKTIPFELGAVAASLGFKEAFEVTDVMARLTSLMSVEAKLKVSEKALLDATTVIAGKDAAITNIQNDLNTVTAELDVFKAQEVAAKNTVIESVVDTAILDGKITKESKKDWIAMAQANLDLVKATLQTIPARDKITEVIAQDPANVAAAVTGAETEAAKVAKKVEALVGADFEFKK